MILSTARKKRKWNRKIRATADAPEEAVMVWIRELKTVWQIRYSAPDRNETTESLPKSEYTRPEAKREADWRQQLYDRGKYDPWTQDSPDAAAIGGNDYMGRLLSQQIVHGHLMR